MHAKGQTLPRTLSLSLSLPSRRPSRASHLTPSSRKAGNESKPNEHYRDRIVRAIEFKPGNSLLSPLRTNLVLRSARREPRRLPPSYSHSRIAPFVLPAGVSYTIFLRRPPFSRRGVSMETARGPKAPVYQEKRSCS